MVGHVVRRLPTLTEHVCLPVGSAKELRIVARPNSKDPKSFLQEENKGTHGRDVNMKRKVPVGTHCGSCNLFATSARLILNAANCLEGGG